MEPFNFGVYQFMFIWGYALLPSNAQFQNMACEKQSSTSRNGRQMIHPGPECDMSEKHWCTVKTPNYPEEMLLEIILDNRGIMKKLFGDHREARFLQQEFSNNIYDEPARPPPPLKSKKLKKSRTPKERNEGIINGRFPGSDILANSRHGKKIDDNGAKNMKVIKYSIYLDDHKKSKYRDELEKSKTKSSTNNLTSRPNDKVFNSINIETTTQTTTQKSKTTESELNETTLTTTDLKDETTTIDEFAFKETATTESTTDTGNEQTGKPEDSPEIKLLSATENETSKDDGNASEASTISLDFGDEVSYEKKPLSPNAIQNAFRSELIDEAETQESSVSVATSTSPNFLKGRVEFKPTFPSSNSLNTEQNIYIRPEHQAQQVQWTTPTYDERTTPPREKQTEFSFPSTNNNFPRPTPNYSAEKFSACNSTSEFIAPTWAKNIYGKNLIVINVGSFIQELHIQECEKDVLYRKMFCRRGCRCEQQYRYQKLLVIDPDDECRGIFSDWFRFPSCCVCVCYQRPNGMNRNARFMHEMDYEDEDYEDYLEDDLDDPSVRFYYGLDLIDKEEVWQDLEPSASNQRVYTSFTDIHSIDRSFSVETPHQETNRDVIWSNGLNSLDVDDKLSSSKVVSDYTNSSSTTITRDKKSRLLKGFNRTVNVRPQIAPRRIPPPRASVGSYSFPWVNSPALSIWPSIAMYNRHFALYNKNNGISSRSFSGDTPRYVTPSPSVGQRSTVGTLNAATPPYFDWKRRPIHLENTTLTGQGKSNLLSRIPRGVRNRGNS